MLSLFLLLLLLPTSLFALPTPDNPMGEYAPDCLVDQPSVWDESRIVQKWYKIDLDAEVHDRWREVANDYIPQMISTIDVVKTMAVDFLGEGAWDALLALMSGAPDKLTEPYRSEIHAMADLTGISIDEITLLNLFYEISAACTSLVAMDVNGKIIHGRNLDFGILFIWDVEKHTWGLTEGLRDLMVQMEFYKDGKLLFRGVNFAGHLGLLTAVRPGEFSVSTNTRFGSSLDSLTNFFLHGLNDNQQFILYANRDMMTNCATFDEAKQYIENVPLLAPGYFIMGHPKGGMVVSRAVNVTDNESDIDTSKSNGWYVLQTNYDWNKPDAYLDQRTIPGNTCMQKLGRKRVTKEGIFQVMSSKPNLNKSTVYTSIIELETGIIHTFKQTCADPCWYQ